METPPAVQEALKSVLTVGDGRGFVIKVKQQRLVVTAAHCLPELPPPHLAAYLHEKTFKLLAPLHQKASLLTECLFADPVHDIAVLTSPDDQELPDDFDAYEALTQSLMPLRIADAPEEGRAWLLSLKNEWFCCHFRRSNIGRVLVSPLHIGKLQQPIERGMSGSPIVSDEGTALGIVNAGGNGVSGWGQTNLFQCLPGFCLPRRWMVPS
jgi:Trypsin-like peptidase domain